MGQSIQTYQKSNDMLKVLSSDDIVQVRSDIQTYPRFKSIPEKSRVGMLAIEIRQCASLMRIQDYGKEDAILAASVLNGMMLEDQYMADLTFPEIHDAFIHGLFGKYGNHYGLTAMTLYGFLQGFIESETKKEAAKKLNASTQKEDMYYVNYRRKVKEEMEAAIKAGTFKPSRRYIKNYEPRKVEDVIDSEAHREKIRLQREQILKEAGLL